MEEGEKAEGTEHEKFPQTKGQPGGVQVSQSNAASPTATSNDIQLGDVRDPQDISFRQPIPIDHIRLYIFLSIIGVIVLVFVFGILAPFSAEAKIKLVEQMMSGLIPLLGTAIGFYFGVKKSD